MSLSIRSPFRDRIFQILWIFCLFLMTTMKTGKWEVSSVEYNIILSRIGKYK